MPKIDIAATHPYALEDAKNRLMALFAKFSTIVALKVEWTSPAEAAISGKYAKGTLSLKVETVAINLSLPFVLFGMKGEIKRRITKELTDAGFRVK